MAAEEIYIETNGGSKMILGRAHRMSEPMIIGLAIIAHIDTCCGRRLTVAGVMLGQC